IATTGEEPADRPDCMTDSRTNEAPAAVPTGPLVDSRSPGLLSARETHQSPRPGLLHGDLVRFHHSGHTVSTLPEAKPAVKGRRGAYRNNRYSYRRSITAGLGKHLLIRSAARSRDRTSRGRARSGLRCRCHVR